MEKCSDIPNWWWEHSSAYWNKLDRWTWMWQSGCGLLDLFSLKKPFCSTLSCWGYSIIPSSSMCSRKKHTFSNLFSGCSVSQCETCGDFMKRPRIQAPSLSDCPRFEISVPADQSCHGPLCQLYIRFATPFKASVGLFLQLSLSFLMSHSQWDCTYMQTLWSSLGLLHFPPLICKFFKNLIVWLEVITKETRKS